MALKRIVGVALLTSLTVVCGGNGPTTPTPSPTPTPTPQPVTAALSGRVTAGGSPVNGASVQVTSGANAGMSTTTAADGTYRLSALQLGTFQLRVSATGLATMTTSVSLTGDAVADFSLVPAPSASTQGRVLDGITNVGLGGVTITGAGFGGTSDASGQFSLTADTGDSSPREATFAGPNVLTRLTLIRVPGPDAVVPMIPASFDLNTFNEMLRAPILRRWVTAPPLLIERRTLQYADVNASSATSVGTVMTDAEHDGLLSDLRSALGSMTGDAAYGFASVTSQQSPQGTSVTLLNTGRITVARLSGLTQGTGFWGYGRWQSNGRGEIISGIVMLDRDFDAGTNPSVRTLRAHELGHALGYNHVTGRASVMNSSATLAPTPFDLDAFRLAFQRMPGNRTPDIDPSDASLNLMWIEAGWGPPIR